MTSFAEHFAFVGSFFGVLASCSIVFCIWFLLPRYTGRRGPRGEEFWIKMRNFGLKMRNFGLKMTNFGLKMPNSVFKRWWSYLRGARKRDMDLVFQNFRPTCEAQGGTWVLAGESQVLAAVYAHIWSVRRDPNAGSCHWIRWCCTIRHREALQTRCGL